MFARITRDYIAQGEWPSATGTTFGAPERQEGELLKVRLLDDDDVVYYHADSDDDALETLFNWSMRDAGTTVLEVRKGDAWEAVIA